MKTVILAGGFGTRLTEETSLRPKPMVEVGEKPMIWHIMKIYSAHGLNDFIICCGYKGYMIKEYFANYFLHMSDITLDIQNNKMEVHQHAAEPWKITLIDTGDKTLTGGRLKRARAYVGDETFCMTYGDGLTNLDLGKLIRFHKEQKTLATLTAVQPPGRFGAFNLSEKQTKIQHFREKTQGDGAWINGGFFVLEPAVFERLHGDEESFEGEPLESLAADGELAAFPHAGFWQPMDTLRDKRHLEALWNSGAAPWKVW